MPQQLEQEMKLDVEPGWSVPELTGVIHGARAVALPALALEATYYDTVDLRLARQGTTLRVRRETPLGPQEGEAAEEWTLKLPSTAAGGVLARQELTWPANAPGATTRRRPARPPVRPVHPEPARLVRGITLGLPLVPVAYLATVRERTVVQTSDGRHLAEVDRDSVAGRRLLDLPGEARMNGATGLEPSARFEEVEVELTPGSAMEVMHAVVARLVQAGARPSPRSSKLREVLGDAVTSAGPPLTAAAGPGAAPGRARALADVLRQQAGSCLAQVLEHDMALRTDDPDLEHVHKARVAVRRFRTILRSYHRLLHSGETEPAAELTAWVGTLRAELRWLGDALGQARDADVRAAAVERDCLGLPLADAEGAAALTAAAAKDRSVARLRLLEAIGSERYVHALQVLQGMALPGSAGGEAAPAALWDALAVPAATGATLMARKEWRALLKAVRRLGPTPSDAALHRARIKAKRVRYLAEVAGPLVTGNSAKAATTTVAMATRLQDVLGELHDAVVMEAWLRNVAGAGPVTGTPTALAAGQLVAHARDVRQRALAGWETAWQKLRSDKTTGWLS